MAGASSSLPPNEEQQQQPQVPDNKRARPDDDSNNTANDIELREDMPQQKRQKRARGAKEKRLPDDVDEGEGAAANLSPSLNSPTDLTPVPQPQSVHSGWNQGIKGRLRTSFARPAVTAAAAPKAAIVSFGQENDKTMADRAQNDGDGASTKDEVTTPSTETSAGKKQPSKRSKKRAREKANKAANPTKDAKEVKEAKRTIWKADFTITLQGQTWFLPALWTSPPEDAKLKGRAHETWDRRFVDWFEAFVALNPSPFLAAKQAKAGSLGNLVQEAYSVWHNDSKWMSKNHLYESLQGMSRYKKKHEELAKIIADVQSRPPPTVRTQQEDGESLPTSALGAISSTPADSNEREDGETDSSVSDLDPDMTEARDSSGFLEVERYFPGIAADVVFCTSCAGFGHRSDSCPEDTCRFCQDSKHLSSGCPKRGRCSRCGQLGHNSSECVEKLALAPGEDMECAFCQSRAHREEDCTDFCRSYWPSEDSIHKVNNIPIYCYACGTQGHYGTDCGLNRSRSVGIVTETWSKANWQRYVDSNSAEDPISGPVSSEQDAPDRPDFGHGIAPQTHIYFEDSDDNDDNHFIRAQVQRPQQHGQIQIAPTRSQGRDRQVAYDYSQPRNEDFYPPLPPGPPPSHHGPGNLPARPPQPSSRPQRAHKPKPKNPKDSQQQGGQRQGGQQNGQGPSRGGGGGRGGRGGGRGFSKLRGRGGRSGRN